MGEQRLHGANITGNVLTSNVWLLCLQGKACHRVAQPVPRKTDDTSSNLARVLVDTGKERSVRTTKAEMHTKARSISEGNICAQLSRRREQRKRKEVRSYVEKRPLLVDLLYKTTVFPSTTIRVRALCQNSNEILFQAPRCACCCPPVCILSQTIYQDPNTLGTLKPYKYIANSCFKLAIFYLFISCLMMFVDPRLSKASARS